MLIFMLRESSNSAPGTGQTTMVRIAEFMMPRTFFVRERDANDSVWHEVWACVFIKLSLLAGFRD